MKRTIDMLRPHIHGLPEIVVPERYRLATAAELQDPRPAWAELLNVSFGETGWTPEKLQEQYISKPQFDPQGAFFVLHGERMVATAFAWRDEAEDTVTGRVHFVGVSPQERGNGLGRAVVVAVMQYFHERGYHRVMLGTQGYRTAAVQLYLSLGFDPWPHDAEEKEIWRVWLEKQKAEIAERAGSG